MGHQHDNDNDEDEFQDEHRHPAGFLGGVALGGLVGVAVGLLLAPAAGQVTRQKLRDRAVSARDQAVEAAEGARDQALHAAEEVRAKAEDLQTSGREMLEENKRRIVRTAEAVKHSAQEAWTNPDKEAEASGTPAAPGQSSSMYNLMGQSGAGQASSAPARNGEAAKKPAGTGGTTGASALR